MALSHICRSEPSSNAQPLQGTSAKTQLTVKTDQQSPSHAQTHSDHSGAFPSCQWADQGFPKGPALLTYLHAELAEAECHTAPLVRFLFVSAFQPYIRHIRSWMYSTAAVDVAFAATSVVDESDHQQLPDSKMVRPSCVRSPSAVATLSGAMSVLGKMV